MTTEEERAERPSRSQKKREATQLQDLGAELLDLPPDVLAGVPMPAELRTAVDDVRDMRSRGARRRLMQRIGALMREVDPVPIRDALERWRSGRGRTSEAEQRARAWRDRLVDGDDTAVDEVTAAAPSVERAQLLRFVEGARRERAQGRPPRDARALFRLLRDALPG